MAPGLFPHLEDTAKNIYQCTHVEKQREKQAPVRILGGNNNNYNIFLVFRLSVLTQSFVGYTLAVPSFYR